MTYRLLYLYYFILFYKESVLASENGKLFYSGVITAMKLYHRRGMRDGKKPYIGKVLEKYKRLMSLSVNMSAKERLVLSIAVLFFDLGLEKAELESITNPWVAEACNNPGNKLYKKLLTCGQGETDRQPQKRTD